MLTYQPQNDVNYCIYRFFSLFFIDENKEYAIDTFKIIDFFYMFPHFIKNIKVRKEQISERNSLDDYCNVYAIDGNQKQLFERLNNCQEMAFEILVSKKILDIDKFQEGIVLLNNSLDIASRFIECIEETNLKNKKLLNFLTKSLASVQLYGKGGLKDRSKVMEYKYDTII